LIQMGKVNKKNAQKRRFAAEENDDKKRAKNEVVEEEVPVELPKLVKAVKKTEKKKKVKVPEPEPEPEEADEEMEEEAEVDDEEEDDVDGEEDSDEEDEDEEESDDESGDESEKSGGDFLKETGEKLDFDFEAFPLEEEDKEGINNMLTQIFLRADIDLVGLGKALIAQSPLGCVIGPAEDVADEDNTTSNVVYGLITMLPEIDKEEKYAKDIFALLKSRATKIVSSVAKDFDAALSSSARLGLFVNERMLHFPDAIAAPACKSLLEDLNAMKKPPTHILYIHKIRIVEDESEEKEEQQAASTSGGAGKKKKGKAEKKRLAAAALASKEIEYDNGEDEILLNLPGGTAVHFDYQCHSDIDPGSKFSIQKKDTLTKTPYRRAVIMDLARFKAFLNAVGNV
ncbi:hypothetical protein PFISCL1PPCAC_7872, partial [Pristionchus fissidentatus]